MNITLAEGYGVATMLAVAVAAIAAVGAFYYLTPGDLKPSQRRILFALRSSAILLVVFLLFRPVLSYQKEIAERPAVIFLLDNSASMSIADDDAGTTRFDQARGKLDKWCEKLHKGFRIFPFVFAERAELLQDIKNLQTLAPVGKATSLARALIAAGKQMPPGEAEAVILLSDGINNTSGDPAAEAKKIGTVVHCVGVGASLRSNPSYRDVVVAGIDCPDRLMLGNAARITASIDAVGLAGRAITAFLDEDGKQVAETELTLDETEGGRRAEFEFRPGVKGRHTYTVRVPPVAEENITQNNQRSASAMVVEEAIRVLYVEGTLRAEYGALVDRFLAKDPNVEFLALVQTRPNFFLKRTNISGLNTAAIPGDQESIDKFHVFIFGDIDSSYIRPAQQEMFVKRVRAGAGLLMLGGYHSLGPGGYAATPLGESLPMVLGDRRIGQLTDPFLPTLTPDGSHHPIFANIAGFFPTLQGRPKIAGLPELDGCTRVKGAKPGATVLATAPTGAGAMPMFAVQPLDAGRTAVFAGDTTRRWQQGPLAMNRESPFLRFWGQTIRWLAGRTAEIEEKAEAKPDETAPEPVWLHAEFEKLDLDERMLERIAEESGGRYLPISTADHLIDQLDRRQKKKTAHVERPLYSPPLFWAAFVAVLTAEWILRRRYQLR